MMMAEAQKSILDNDLVEWARGKVKQHQSSNSEWTDEAIKAFDCVAGNQWAEQDRNDLEADSRPIFTFNRVAGFIRGICGLETSTRNQVQLFAREINDSGVSDVYNAAVSYVRDGCDADDEESDAFKDMLICGLGWTETLFSTEEDIDGNIVVERVDPMHMRWDAAARKRGLADSRWRARDKRLPLSTIRDVWGDDKADELEAMLDSDTDMLEELTATPHDATAARNYDSDQAGNTKALNGVKVTQFQYVKTVQFVQFTNPFTNAVEELEEADFNKVKKRFDAQGLLLMGQKFKKRQYRQLIYAGCVELEDGALPCQGFTLQPITGIRDRNKGIWYGFIRDLQDPQGWINKFFSSMADCVASQAKGGLLAEVDAFINKDDAENDWANPRTIVWLKRDGLGKIKERASQGVPAGISQLLDFTVDSLPNVAGVNLEFLGLAGREQPGVLEHQRKQAAIATLAEFFNALRLYRKQQGRVLLQFINEFISDGRLIRIVGKEDAKYVPIARLPDSLKFDIIVDEAPTSPDQKERTWGALTQILPIAGSMGFPVPPEIIDYAPFPQSLIDSWKKFASGDAGMPPQVKAKMQQMQEQLGALEKENQALKSKKEESMAKIQVDQSEGEQKLKLQEQEMLAKIALERQKFEAEMQLKQQEFIATMQLERQKMAGQMGMQREKMVGDLTIKQQQSMQSAANSEPSSEGGEESGDAFSLFDMFANVQKETSQALQAMAQAVQALATAHGAAKTIKDGKGRSFTITSGGE